MIHPVDTPERLAARIAHLEVAVRRPATGYSKIVQNRLEHELYRLKKRQAREAQVVLDPRD